MPDQPIGKVHAPLSDEAMRIDRLLVYLRFAKTRCAARSMIEGCVLRRNRKRVGRVSEAICVGDVLTLPIGNEVRVIEVLSLPTRRSSATIARSHYRELDL